MSLVDESASLAEELAAAASAMLRNLFKQAGSTGQQKYPTLARVVQRIVGEERWRNRPNLSLIDVMHDAIQELPRNIEVRAGRRTFLPVPARGAPEREMAEILYGYRDDTLPPRFHAGGDAVEQWTYDDDYLPAALRRAGLSDLNKKDQGRSIRIIREDLADVLLLMEQEALARQQQAAEQAAAETASPVADYINRPQYEDQFAAHLQAGARIFLLYGDAGTGKTTLARHLAMSHANASGDAQTSGLREGRATFIEINSQAAADVILYEDVSSALQDLGVEVPATALLRRRFREVIASDQAPRAVLLDNAENWKDVEALVPETPNCVVLVTSRQKLTKSAAVVSLPIGKMTADEAAQMIRSQLPDLGDEGAARLAGRLDYRPLAIRHACGFLAQPPRYGQSAMTVESFLELLQNDTATVMDSVVHQTDEPTLTTIYRLTIGALEPNPLKLLDYIAAMGMGMVSTDLLRMMWNGDDLFSTGKRESSVPNLTFDHALTILEQRCLVVMQSYRGADDRFVLMHPLTNQIISELRKQACTAIRRSVLQAMEDAPILSDWQIDKTLPISQSNRALGFRMLLTQLFRTGRNDAYFPHVAKLAAFIVRCITEDHPEPGDTLWPVESVLAKYDMIRGEEADDQPCIPQQSETSLRRHNDQWALIDEMWHFKSIFPESAKDIDLRLGEMEKEVRINKLPHLLLGCEFHPFWEDSIDAYRQWDAPQVFADAGEVWLQERQYLNSGNAYFSLGTLYFDAGAYPDSLRSYQRSHEVWSHNPRYFAGELCKAAARVADVYHRMGRSEEAEQWRLKAITGVKEHIGSFGIKEWTGDHAANYFLFKMLLGYPQGITGSNARVATQAFKIDLTNLYEPWFGPVGAELDNLARDLMWDSGVFFEGYRRSLAHSIAADDPIEAAKVIAEVSDRVTLKEWPAAHMRLSLSSVKIGMHVIEAKDSIEINVFKGGGRRIWEDRIVDTLISGAHYFDKITRSPYWYGECLLAAYVLCARYGYGNAYQAEHLAQSLRKPFASIGRTDRLELARAAKDADFNPLWLLAE